MEELTRQHMVKLLAAMTAKERDTPPLEEEMDAWVLVFRDVDDEHGITVRRGTPCWLPRAEYEEWANLRFPTRSDQ